MRDDEEALTILVKVRDKDVFRAVSFREDGRLCTIYIVGRGVGLLSGLHILNNWYAAIFEDYDIMNYKAHFICSRSVPDRSVLAARIGSIFLSCDGRERGVLRLAGGASPR